VLVVAAGLSIFFVEMIEMVAQRTRSLELERATILNRDFVVKSVVFDSIQHVR